MHDDSEITIKDLSEQTFSNGSGVVMITTGMTDAQILAIIKAACAWSNGKAFQVISVPHVAGISETPRFLYNPHWPTRTDPLLVVKVLQDGTGMTMDRQQQAAICAVLDALPIGATMDDLVKAMMSLDELPTPLTATHYSSLKSIVKRMSHWKPSAAYAELFNKANYPQ
ncbi:hypothetical protein [Pseudomonas syringae pv. coryli]|uniref:hypothetical protein n=1 Tax=Pseudomonas syringae pv. coryli TaxID=317659 RepID=UPI003D271302